ncbi:MAG: N-acetylglutaminylglutamine synthetase [Alphaproteobacteria bacterium]|nr:N-acetylglutaminylglutamine synthetase [Alphaproteobacteria bacterium]
MKSNALYNPEQSPSLKSWGEPADLPRENVSIACGWGRLVFGHTFRENDEIVSVLKNETDGQRDLALYIRNPHVVVAGAPQSLFIDPSYTFRLTLADYESLTSQKGAFHIRPLDVEKDTACINRIYQSRKMVPIEAEALSQACARPYIKYWVAVDDHSDTVMAVCMGIDHKAAFDDPENGSSLWALAVDPQAKHPALGFHLVQHVTEYFKDKGRAFMDVSVLHSNKEAIALYEKLGFVQVPVYCVKNKNAINEKLFTGPKPAQTLNPYAMIIINEARRRGIRVEVLDEEENYFRLSMGASSIVCRESLSELTSAIAMSRCSDKRTTSRLLKKVDLRVPDQIEATDDDINAAFLKRYKRLVVKPAIGEQGAGITVDVRTLPDLERAINFAQTVSSTVLLEEMVEGRDLRIIVINQEVVAAALRKPPEVVGDGHTTIRALVEKQSRRRAQATQGESTIPMDAELERTIAGYGYTLEDILPKGEILQVRKAANLHMGGTIHDVTDILHPTLAEAAIKTAKVLDIPVTGLDFIVKDPAQAGYAIIEANERPGLANHEPQPTAQKFVDLLFPQSIAKAA